MENFSAAGGVLEFRGVLLVDCNVVWSTSPDVAIRGLAPVSRGLRSSRSSLLECSDWEVIFEMMRRSKND